MKTAKKMTKKQMEEFEKAIADITKEAKSVVEDYIENPSEASGSAVQVHEDSPFVDDSIKGNGWKKVVRSTIIEELANKNKKKNKKA